MTSIKVHKPRVKKISYNFVKDVKDYFKNADLVKDYIISGSSSIWWALTFIFIPMYIIENGLGVQWVAYFLFAIVAPLVMFEYYFSKKTNTWGFKKLFVMGNLIPLIVLIGCFFVSNIYWLLGLMVLGTVGIAMVEATSEAYFFFVAPKKQPEKYYSIYNTTLDVFSFIGKIVIAGLLIFFTLKISFLFLALIFGLFTIVSSRMKEVNGKISE